jgi:hypothetical protein
LSKTTSAETGKFRVCAAQHVHALHFIPCAVQVAYCDGPEQVVMMRDTAFGYRCLQDCLYNPLT